MSDALKGKRIACFVALPHHTRFLSPLMERAERCGAKPLYFTVMGDFPFERDLVKKGKECRILQAYANAKTRHKLEESTRRFWDLWTARCFEWDGLRHWPFVLQSSLLTSGLEEYVCLEAFIEQERPDLFLALHERNRWGKLIGHLAARYGIPYVTLQEGDYYEDRLSFSGHTEYSTALMLWGRDTQDRLVRLRSSPEKMVLIGNTHLSTVKHSAFAADQIARTKRELNLPPDKPVVLFLVGLQWGVIKDLAIWEELLCGLGDDVAKVFKWHPKVTFTSYKKNAEEAFRATFPSCVVLQNYDPYRLLPITDYCVTLGKTTLAVEALSFGKPLFSLPGRDGEVDHYAAWGISQALWPPGNWEPLYRTIKEGVPPAVQKEVDAFLERYFYRVNAVAVDRGVDVMRHVLACRTRRVPAAASVRPGVPGRVSYIVPSGEDAEALVKTLAALAEHVTDQDWEVVLVVHHENAKSVVSALSGDVRVVQARSQNLASLYNQGAREASGELLAFIRPGIEYTASEGVTEAMRQAVVGIPIKYPDGTPCCLGFTFDFNHVPRPLTTEDAGARPLAVGGGFLGIRRELFRAVGGFDERLADQFAEVDLCLSAMHGGHEVRSVPTALGLVRAEPATEAASHRDSAAGSDDEWKGRVAFFAKWAGRLPKQDNYLAFAGDLLKV